MLKNFVILFALCVILTLGDHIEEAQEHNVENFVMGGANAPQGLFPWTASIRVRNNFCQGVILNENHVLTAATCVTEQNVAINHFWVRVFAGDLHITGSNLNREERSLSHLFIHDSFNPVTLIHNLAIGRFSAPIIMPHNTIEGAILNTRVIPVGTQLQFAGWQTPLGTDAQRWLRWFSIPSITNAACTTPPANSNMNLTNMFCAGQLTPAPTNSPCGGNFGGGIYLNRELVGIYHRGLTCNQINNPSVYMDIRLYLNWINQSFNRMDLTPPGTTFPRN
ncbi:coagulation factor X-like [Sergentomyia squamirostris]